jgi:chemotaxis protein MotB
VKRHRRHAEPAAHSERWLISYADFITLLFAFFVTMYAISTVDQKKLQKAVAAFQTAFPDSSAAKDSAELPAVPKLKPADGAHPLDGALGLLKSRLAARLQQLDERRVELNMDPRGLVISVREAASFPIGHAELDPEAQNLFREIALDLVAIPNHVRVEGHTDDVPIHTSRYASNWELSTARATTVVAFFTETVGIAPDRLSAAGYAEFHPRVPNDSTEHRAENRRVDIVVLNPQTLTREEPLAGASRDR